MVSKLRKWLKKKKRKQPLTVYLNPDTGKIRLDMEGACMEASASTIRDLAQGLRTAANRIEEAENG